MYLLASLHARLTGDRLTLARQLLYRPWSCDLDRLSSSVSATMLGQFAKLQRHCARIVGSETAPDRFLRLRLGYIALRGEIVDMNNVAVRSDTLALEMYESFVGQAIEDLARVGLSFRALPARDQAAFVSLYAHAWCCFWSMAGVFVADGLSMNYRLADDAALEEAHRLYWFGHHWSYQSSIGDFRLRAMTLSLLRSAGVALEHAVLRRAPLFQQFVTNVLDKYVSFHSDFAAHLFANDKQHYIAMYRRAELICYFYLKSHDDMETLAPQNRMSGQNTALPVDYSIADVLAAGFSRADLDALIDESKANGEGEAFIVSSGPAAVRLGLLNLKYAIGSYLKPMLEAMKKRGDWFDKKYIPSYLKQRVEGPRFRFGPEVKPRSEKEGKYDIDLLIADEELGRLYFCQIKHRVATLLPYFRDEFDEYTRSDQLSYGIGQLTRTKPQFGSRPFLDNPHRSLKKAGASPSFIARVDTAFLAEHVGMIVIHTIENLDFAIKDGIALYEWNTFRNLLRGQITVFTKDTVAVGAPDLRGLALDDPAGISRALTAWSATHGDDNPLHPDKQWFYARHGHVQVTAFWGLQLWRRRTGLFRRTRLTFPVI